MSGEAKKRVLGKGLSALISNSSDTEKKREAAAVQAVPDMPQAIPAAAAASGLQLLSLEQIIPNPDQPRSHFSEQALEELAASIKQQGVLQPVVVTRKGDKYQLICGERRFRAAGMAGLERIPVVVKEVASAQALELALVENIQREDLNPIEEAEAFQRLMGQRDLSQEKVADLVGKDRSTVANALRILRLPKEVLGLVVDQKISAGHARALLPLFSPEHQRSLAERIVKEGLSVRDTEQIVQNTLAGKRPAKRSRKLDPFVQDLENKLQLRLGSQVRIFHHKKNHGRIEIRYFSLDDLDRILDSLTIDRA